jgi:hypothetical protein
MVHQDQQQDRIPQSAEELMDQYLRDEYVVYRHAGAIGTALFPDRTDKAEAANWHAARILTEAIFQGKELPADIGSAVLDRMESFDVNGGIDG